MNRYILYLLFKILQLRFNQVKNAITILHTIRYISIILKTRYIIIYLSFHENIILKFAIFICKNDIYNLYDCIKCMSFIIAWKYFIKRWYLFSQNIYFMNVALLKSKGLCCFMNFSFFLYYKNCYNFQNI